jgi:hypothetical protein
MGFACHTLRKHDHFRHWFCHDLAELKGFLSPVPEIQCTVSIVVMECGKKKATTQPIHSEVLTICIGGRSSLCQEPCILEAQYVDKQSNNKCDTEEQVSKCVIDNHEAARAWYTPQQLFIEKRVQDRQCKAETFAYELRKAKNHEWTEDAKVEWVLLGNAEKEEWKFHAWNHNERQPYIRDQFIEAIQNRPTKSFGKIAADIDNRLVFSDNDTETAVLL